MEQESYRCHVLVVPFHGQGHINPMLQFSKRLAFQGLKITIPTLLSTTLSIQTGFPAISLRSIYDDNAQGGISGPGGFKGFLDRLEAGGATNLRQLVKELDDSAYPVKCIIYDANLPWVLDIAKDLGLLGAAFFTQSSSAIANYLSTYGDDYHYHYHYHYQPKVAPLVWMIPGMPKLVFPTLPSMGPADSGGQSPILRHIMKQFSNIDQADWILFNSFDYLEQEALKWMASIWPAKVKTIGPCVPSFYLDKRVEGDVDYTYNLHNPDSQTCIDWLNTKEAESVIYISFGSVATLNEKQMAEIASFLEKSQVNFLWVVKKSEQSNLPINVSSERGLLVKWCCQLQVLNHPAIGCFVTHCGWNSTIEALSFGVPMVAIPQFVDQFSDAFFVEQVWGVGVRPKPDAEGLVSAEEMESCIGQVMEKNTRQEMVKKVLQWKDLAKAAVDEGGTSDTHTNDIVAALTTN